MLSKLATLHDSYYEWLIDTQVLLEDTIMVQLLLTHLVDDCLSKITIHAGKMLISRDISNLRYSSCSCILLLMQQLLISRYSSSNFESFLVQISLTFIAYYFLFLVFVARQTSEKDLKRHNETKFGGIGKTEKVVRSLRRRVT